MIVLELEKDIHDSDFFTFETSWIGEEIYNTDKRELYIPILNLEVQNKKVIQELGITDADCIYIEESYFIFNGVYKVEKDLRLLKKGFFAKVSDRFEFENVPPLEKFFELGGMGIFKNTIYDGIFKIYSSSCIFRTKEASKIS